MLEIVPSGVPDKCNLCSPNSSPPRFLSLIRVFGRENTLNTGAGNEAIWALRAAQQGVPLQANSQWLDHSTLGTESLWFGVQQFYYIV